jgi:hypothetical protein
VSTPNHSADRCPCHWCDVLPVAWAALESGEPRVDVPLERFVVVPDVSRSHKPGYPIIVEHEGVQRRCWVQTGRWHWLNGILQGLAR